MQPQSTVSYWAKTDKIPGRWFPQLMTLAREHGIPLEAADFVMPRPVPPNESSQPEPEAPGQPGQPESKVEFAVPIVPPLSTVDPPLGDGSRFLFYRSEEGDIRVQVLVQDETVWASQRGMSEIFEVTIPTVNEHLQNIIHRDNEVDESAIRKFRITGPDNKSYETNFYNLDAIISVGYRVNSYKATQFRRWATKVLRSYLIKGFALDDERLKQGTLREVLTELYTD